MSQYLNDCEGCHKHKLENKLEDKLEDKLKDNPMRLLLGCSHCMQNDCGNTRNGHVEFKTLSMQDIHTEDIDYNGNITVPSFYDGITDKFNMIFSERCCGLGEMFGSIAYNSEFTDPMEKEKNAECLGKLFNLLEVDGVFVVRFCDPSCSLDRQVSDHLVERVMKDYENMERINQEELAKIVKEIEDLNDQHLPDNEKNLEVTIDPLFCGDDSKAVRNLIKKIDVNSSELFLGLFTPKEYLNLCKKYGNDPKKIADDCVDIDIDPNIDLNIDFNGLQSVNKFMRNIGADDNNHDLKNIMQKFRNFTMNPDCDFDSDEEFYRVCDLVNLLSNNYRRYMPRFIAYRRKF